MSGDIKWLEVILDFGKRFPNETMGSLGLEVSPSVYNLQLSLLIINPKHSSYMKFDHDTQIFNFFRVLKTVEYWDNSKKWIEVPQHILLRLLTEGKEDLI